uniref:Uncharacterized protein n=1 Tax=Caenorhabditis tropicalis TaxID=1561998 RepID=A0A1I7U6G5_9PELO
MKKYLIKTKTTLLFRIPEEKKLKEEEKKEGITKANLLLNIRYTYPMRIIQIRRKVTSKKKQTTQCANIWG